MKSTHFGNFLDTSDKDMDKMFDVNYKGVFLLIKEALPFMKNRKGANICIMSSVGAYEQDVNCFN